MDFCLDLALQHILKEIEKQESKMSRLLTKHETLRSIAGLKVPTQDLEISAEIAALKAEAQDDRDQLQTLVDEQIEQEEKVKQMEAEIEAAQSFVEESLDNADSIEALQEKAKEADVRVIVHGFWLLFCLHVHYLWLA